MKIRDQFSIWRRPHRGFGMDTGGVKKVLWLRELGQGHQMLWGINECFRVMKGGLSA